MLSRTSELRLDLVAHEKAHEVFVQLRRTEFVDDVTSHTDVVGLSF